MSKTSDVVTRAWQLIEAQDFARFEEVLSPHLEFRMGSDTLRGLREFQAMCQGWWSAFPDLGHEITSSIDSGDTYACELQLSGTHTGTMRTPKGDLPATGRKIRMGSCDYIVVKDGKIVTWHAYPDMVGLLGQLGAA